MKASNKRAKTYPHWDILKVKGATIANYAATVGLCWAHCGPLAKRH